jgi:hypothetical protein
LASEARESQDLRSGPRLRKEDEKEMQSQDSTGEK